MLARSVLQQGKTKNQPRCPKGQQENKRQGSEIAEKIFPPGLALNMTCEFAPRNPGPPIEPARDPEATPHSARQHDGLKRIQEDGEDEDNSDDGKNHMHQALGWPLRCRRERRSPAEAHVTWVSDAIP